MSQSLIVDTLRKCCNRPTSQSSILFVIVSIVNTCEAIYLQRYFFSGRTTGPWLWATRCRWSWFITMPMPMKLWFEKLWIILNLCIMSIFLTSMDYSEVSGKVRRLVTISVQLGTELGIVKYMSIVNCQSWKFMPTIYLRRNRILSSKLRIYLQSCDIIFGETEGFASYTTEPRKDLPRTTEGFASNHRLFWFAFEPLIFFSRSFRKRGIFQVGGTGGCWVAFDFYLQSYRRFTGVGLSCCNWVLSWELSSICQSSIGKCRNR